MDLTNTNILLNLDYPDLINACRSAPELFKICQTPYFWALKIEHDFSISNSELSLVPGSDNKKRYEFILGLKRALETGNLSLLFKQEVNLQFILDNPKIYKAEIVNCVYYLIKVRPVINEQIDYAPIGRFKSFPQGGVKYQENPYRRLWTRIGREIGNAPPGHLKLLPNGSSGYQETKEWIEKEYPN